MKNAKLTPVLILLFAGHVLSGQGLSSVQIDSIVQKSMTVMPVAGIAVAVVKDGKVVHAKGYGVTSANSKEKVNGNTLFAIASNSKAFTTTALAMLIDGGKLNWDDKVVDHIPEFRMYDPYVTANFNVQDLITHRSGLGLGAGDLMFFPDGSDFTINDILKSFQYQKPVSAFRTKYDYDNLLYVVAGELVARVSGMAWAEFVENKIMRPIGMMRSAGVYQRLGDRSNIASPHSVKKDELKELKPYLKNDETLGAAGGIYSSVNDLSKWLLVLLNEGKYGKNLTKQLFSAQNLGELWQAHTNIAFDVKPALPYRTHFSAYGLGWFLQDRAGYVMVEHTGGLPGMLSRTVLIPELNVGIVVLTNTDPGGLSYWTIAQEILDAFIGVERTDWISWAEKRIQGMEAEGDSVTTAVWEIVHKAKNADLNYEDYTGTYRDNWFGDVQVLLKEGKLWFKSLRSPKLTGEMFFYKANAFAIKWNYTDMSCDAFAIFTLDENGRATGIKMKGISPNIDFSFDFHDLDLKRADD